MTGPRQSGKTTLAKTTFDDKPYISLEEFDVLQHAFEDPRGFLDQFPDGAILDEVQRAPKLLSFLQSRVDAAPRLGDWVLTGSQQFGLHERIGQSLAGRVGFVRLWPFSAQELADASLLPPTLQEMLYRGSYPPLYDRPVRPHAWFAAYTASYIERDVRNMLQVHDLLVFQRFVRMCAARTGQLLNLSALAADCGITHNTARAWMSVLEASDLIFLLPPFHRNFGKRLVKAPKLYFVDCGLAAWLAGIVDAESLAIHQMRGPLFETWVIAELHKTIFNRGLPARLSFWRDSAGHEIDVIVESGNQLQAIEIKSGLTVASDMFKALQKWQEIAAGTAAKATLVYGGENNYDRQGCRVLGWRDVAALV